MKNIIQIKEEKQIRLTKLINDCSIFFAFTKKQFEENKTPLEEGEKYMELGSGTYIPKSKFKNYLTGIKALKKWFSEEVETNQARRQHIMYELSNHEVYYTNDISDALAALGGDYTKEEVRAVYNQERVKSVNLEY